MFAAQGPVVIVMRLEGELGLPEIADVGDELLRLSGRGVLRVVVDLARVPHLDYRGVRALAARAQAFRRGGGDLKLCGLSAYLDQIVRASGASHELERYPDAAAARAAFLEPRWAHVA